MKKVVEIEPQTAADVRDDVFRTASEMVDRELEAMDVINSTEVITKVAEFFGLESHELFMYMEHGPEETVRRYGLLQQDNANENENKAFSNMFSDVLNKENIDPKQIAELPAAASTPKRGSGQRKSIFETPSRPGTPNQEE